MVLFNKFIKDKYLVYILQISGNLTNLRKLPKNWINQLSRKLVTTNTKKKKIKYKFQAHLPNE